MLRTISEVFAGMNEHAPIIVCFMLIVFCGIFVAVQVVDNKRRKNDSDIIQYQAHVIDEADKQIKLLRDEIKSERAHTFAARADCKRECSKRDAKINQLETKVNQLVKWSEQK